MPTLIYADDLGNTDSPGFGLYGTGVTDNAATRAVGEYVIGGGDINGDGVGDVIVSCQSGAYVVYGSRSFSTDSIEFPQQTTVGITIIGLVSYLSPALGDVNGDGNDDIILGGYEQFPPEDYIIYGNPLKGGFFEIPTLSSEQGFSIQGDVGSWTGFAVSSGDVNGDGIDDIIIGSPPPAGVSSSNIPGVYVVYGAKSGFTTPSPSSSPTTPPTSQPTSPEGDDDQLLQDGLKAVYAIASTIASAILAWVLRFKIAYYVLDNWGHEYKFIYNDYAKNAPDDKDIGLKLDDSGDGLICITKHKDLPLSLAVDDTLFNGISTNLHAKVIDLLKNPTGTDPFTYVQPKLIQHEKNQIRDYLVKHSYIKTEKNCYCIEGYKELGLIKGIIYNGFYESSFKILHSQDAHKNGLNDKSHNQQADSSSYNFQELLVSMCSRVESFFSNLDLFYCCRYDNKKSGLEEELLQDNHLAINGDIPHSNEESSVVN